MMFVIVVGFLILIGVAAFVAHIVNIDKIANDRIEAEVEQAEADPFYDTIDPAD